LASIRYRVLAPARYLQEQGHQNQFLRLDQTVDGEQLTQALRADVVVISKIFAGRSVELVRQAQAYGARVIVDICDDHFDTPDLSQAYGSLCGIADRIVASTAAMAKVIHQRTGKHAAIVDDPYEGPHGEPRFSPAARAVQLLWFGHPVNFDTVADMVPKLATLSRSLPLSLHVVSDATNSNIRAFLDSAAAQHKPGLTTRFTPWSPEATWEALGDCDLVVVPSLPAAKKHVKSPNRVVEPLRAGRFVVAYPLPSYVELQDFIWLGENMADGIVWAMSNRNELGRRLEAGQDFVNRRFSPLTVARVWEAVLLQTAECDRHAA
jgi:glycosyltransferase involved in cell wall biosynthesis